MTRARNRIRGQGHNYVLNGAADRDTVLFDDSDTGVTASLSTGTATGDGTDTLTAVEDLIGSDLVDTLLGNGSANRLSGRDGNDSLSGRGGYDVLLGELGNDDLSGGAQQPHLQRRPGH